MGMKDDTTPTLEHNRLEGASLFSVFSRFQGETVGSTIDTRPGNGLSETSIENGVKEKGAFQNGYFAWTNPITSTSLPSSSALVAKDVWDIASSEYFSTNAFSPYSSAWETTTTANNPMSGLAVEFGDEIISDGVQLDSNYDNGNGTLEHNSTDLSLPPDFTEISQLNKDCIVVYVLLFILAAVGNILVLYCVSRYDRLGKSRTPLLIMNLCIADLIVTFFLIPTEIFWRFTIAWKGGDLLCKLSQFVRAFGMYLSSNVVICISIDRYFAIVYPLKLAGAVKRVKWTLVAAWIVSGVFAGPQMLVYHVASHPQYPEFRQCVTKAFLKTEPYNELIYNVSSVSALYFIPLVVIIYTYTMILWKIHQKSREHRVANSQQETIGSESNHCQTSRTAGNHLNIPQSHFEMTPLRQSEKSNSLKRSASKRTRLMLRSSANQTATLTRARSRTLRLTLLILMTFIFCWTPYVVMTLWYMLDRGGASQVDERLQEALFIMAVTNSVLNPLIYGTVGRKQDFKKRFNALLRSSSGTHDFLKYACCCGYVYRHCCEQGERRSSETIIITLNRTNRGSSRRSRLGAECNGGTSYPEIPSSPSNKRDSDLSPKSQIVALKSSANTDTGIVSRFIRSLTNNNRRRDEITHELSCANERGIHECTECGGSGTVVTAQYVVARGTCFVTSENCTQL